MECYIAAHNSGLAAQRLVHNVDARPRVALHRIYDQQKYYILSYCFVAIRHKNTRIKSKFVLALHSIMTQHKTTQGFAIIVNHQLNLIQQIYKYIVPAGNTYLISNNSCDLL